MFHVTVLPGDGIGPEITQSAVNVLKAAAELFQIELSFSTCDFGGISLDPVSYTHLDVYKRQMCFRRKYLGCAAVLQRCADRFFLPGLYYIV